MRFDVHNEPMLRWIKKKIFIIDVYQKQLYFQLAVTFLNILWIAVGQYWFR